MEQSKIKHRYECSNGCCKVVVRRAAAQKGRQKLDHIELNGKSGTYKDWGKWLGRPTQTLLYRISACRCLQCDLYVKTQVIPPPLSSELFRQFQRLPVAQVA